MKVYGYELTWAQKQAFKDLIRMARRWGIGFTFEQAVGILLAHSVPERVANRAVYRLLQYYNKAGSIRYAKEKHLWVAA